MSFDIEYKKIIKQCLENGALRQTRDVPAYSVLGVSISLLVFPQQLCENYLLNMSVSKLTFT